ncbi:MAG: ComF family protein [Defluviitaleaceae bacterium]|nr:ComF family protein [Defluviitaleaceae bacterium]MCL2836058.1 ComF family protein [Defluviitaleaceae bacterium]
MKTSLIANKLLMLLYPKRCLLCDEVQQYGAETDLCAECRETVYTYAPAAHSMLPTVYSELHRVHTAFRYEGPIRDAVRRLKFHGMKENAPVMAALMKQAVWPDDFKDDIAAADFLVPVPLHKSRINERGFNQAGLLALALEGEYGIPVFNALIRTQKTESMYGLTRTRRFENVRGAFTVSGDVRDKNIILVDDIYTTGATVEECARVLKKAGAKRVCALTFAAASGDDRDDAGYSAF